MQKVACVVLILNNYNFFNKKNPKKQKTMVDYYKLRVNKKVHDFHA